MRTDPQPYSKYRWPCLGHARARNRLVARVNELRPDLVAVVGDIVDGNVSRVESLQPILMKLRAPLGVWAVSGNHEFYAGVEPCVRLLQDAGFTVLRDGWAEAAPGLLRVGLEVDTPASICLSSAHGKECEAGLVRAQFRGLKKPLLAPDRKNPLK